MRSNLPNRDGCDIEGALDNFWSSLHLIEQLANLTEVQVLLPMMKGESLPCTSVRLLDVLLASARRTMRDFKVMEDEITEREIELEEELDRVRRELNAERTARQLLERSA